jgi:hypothetical protein
MGTGHKVKVFCLGRWYGQTGRIADGRYTDDAGRRWYEIDLDCAAHTWVCEDDISRLRQTKENEMSNTDKELARIYREYQQEIDKINSLPVTDDVRSSLEDDAYTLYVTNKINIYRERSLQ